MNGISSCIDAVELINADEQKPNDEMRWMPAVLAIERGPSAS
jgi:hypothetical protein